MIFWIALTILVAGIGFAVWTKNAGVGVLGVLVSGILLFVGATKRAVQDFMHMPAWVTIDTLLVTGIVVCGFHLRDKQNSRRPLGVALLVATLLGLPVMIWGWDQHGVLVHLINVVGSVVLAIVGFDMVRNPKTSTSKN